MEKLRKQIKLPLRRTLLLAGCLIFAAAISNPASVFAQSDKVYSVVDKMPEMKGGLSTLYKKIKYPDEARRKGISGRVYLQFVVDKNGKPKDPKVIRGIGGGCGEAAISAIEKVKFSPGIKDGKPVKVKFTLPVTFRIRG